ncbi:MAG TPA: SDR family oxidoreductase, partial [Thermoleophilaceae bacterium]|nr:SDR family oxidoreductase [Thermoleophilaceae bacterium]
MSAKAFASLAEGESARWEHQISSADVDAFAALSGDDNPLHMDDAFARQQGYRGRVVHGMLLGAYLSRVVGTMLPGPGVVWLSQEVRFVGPAYIGDTVEVAVRITHKSPALRTLVLESTITNQHGDKLVTGEGKMMMLAQKTTVPWTEMVALVTGGSRGIGASVARALGDRGATVVVNYHERRDPAEEVVAAIEAAGGRALAVQADIADEQATVALADAALEAFGRVDAVVNNATPPIERKPLEELSWAEVDRYWRSYVQSAFLLSERLVPGMKERGFGRFVHMLTTATWGTPPRDVAGYVAAKSGLWGLARSMAVELAPHGITVNGVSPSAVITDQWAEASDNRRRALAMSVPAQRLASPEEVASTVLFLLGEEGSY